MQAATEGGYLEIVKFLLDNDADINGSASRLKGRTALQAADESRHTDIAQLLSDHKTGIRGVARDKAAVPKNLT